MSLLHEEDFDPMLDKTNFTTAVRACIAGVAFPELVAELPLAYVLRDWMKQHHHDKENYEFLERVRSEVDGACIDVVISQPRHKKHLVLSILLISDNTNLLVGRIFAEFEDEGWGRLKTAFFEAPLTPILHNIGMLTDWMSGSEFEMTADIPVPKRVIIVDREFLEYAEVVSYTIEKCSLFFIALLNAYLHPLAHQGKISHKICFNFAPPSTEITTKIDNTELVCSMPYVVGAYAPLDDFQKVINAIHMTYSVHYFQLLC